MYWRLGAAYKKRPRARNKAALRTLTKRGPPPGLLALDGDLAVGWCQLTPRADLPWLARAPHVRPPGDDESVWALSCFYVRRGYRQQGVAADLIDAALRAAKEAGASALIYASSVGAYSPGPKDRRVDESWPTDGTPTSYYARHKAEVERRLDRFEREAPEVRVVRMRPGLVFKKEAAEGIRRLFIGPFLPSPLVRTALINAIPDIPNLRSQIVHSYDVGEAFRLAIVNDEAHGAFNLAAEPPLDPEELGRILDARPVPVSAQVARASARLSWQLRLQPAPEGWLDMAMSVPVMGTSRARRELGWTPEHSADEALLDLLEGLRTGAGLDTPPLSPKTGGPLRIREILTGVGGREP
jgi:nucleoside-diphosphate-sugar epimerase